MPGDESKHPEGASCTPRESSRKPEPSSEANTSTVGSSSRDITSKSTHPSPGRTISPRRPSQEPEFWISDDKPMQLGEVQEFSITVKRTSDPAPKDYTRIWLYEWVAGLDKFAPTHPQKLWGTVMQPWNGGRSVKFDDLALLSDGLFRVRVDIMQYNGGAGKDIIVQTLFSENIHMKFPELDVYVPEDEDSNEVSKGK
ncbi:hypothetical protein F5Y06DRAFT_297928 [Hypoxylon sp. FL0890]|nr:hypothetical protein F5Y06DRAFT_297928 [Hypoxylon sp. FL0890]